MPYIRPLLIASFCFALAGIAGPAAAQTSGKMVRLIVPFAAGGGQDILARSFNNELGAALGQTVIVEYRAGAGGSLGSAYVAKSEPDSLAFVVAAGSHITSVLLSSKPLYDPVRDFAAVSHIGTGIGQVLIINSQIPANTVAEFVNYAKANPGKLNYGSAGSGSATHLAMAYFVSLAGIDIVHIPYKSNAEPMNELLAGRIQATMFPGLSALPFMKESRARMLAVTAREKSRFLPSLPTVAESGMPGYAYESWFGLLGPAATPRPVVDRINGEMAKVLKEKIIAERLSKIGMEPLAMSPDAFAQLLRADYERLAKIVKISGAKID